MDKSTQIYKKWNKNWTYVNCTSSLPYIKNSCRWVNESWSKKIRRCGCHTEIGHESIHDVNFETLGTSLLPKHSLDMYTHYVWNWARVASHKWHNNIMNGNRELHNIRKSNTSCSPVNLLLESTRVVSLPKSPSSFGIGPKQKCRTSVYERKSS